MGTCPVGLHDTTLRTTCGGGGVETSVANESENGVFVRGVHTLVLENFGGADAVGVAGLSLCAFHLLNRASIARRKPRGFPRGLPRKIRLR